MLRTLALGGAALALSACVIVVDGTDGNDWSAEFATGSYAGPFEAATTENLEAFDGIKASAGTDITVSYGDTFSIALDDKAAQRSTFRVRGDTLEITCRKPCNNGSRGEVEVTAPSLKSLSVSSGADLTVNDGFVGVDTLSLSVSSGGHLDARGIEGDTVSASASSGGSMRLSVGNSLSGSASSGGSIKYWGQPGSVQVSTSSGGSVRQGD